MFLSFFIFVCAGSSLLNVGFSLQKVGATLSCMGSVVPGMLLCGKWDRLGPGIEPVFPALAGGFFTTEPPEKSSPHFINALQDGLSVVQPVHYLEDSIL